MPRCPYCERVSAPDPDTGYDGAEYCSISCERRDDAERLQDEADAIAERERESAS